MTDKYELDAWMYRALVRRLVEIADAKDDDAMAIDEVWRLIDYDRVARAHEPNIKEKDDVSSELL
jgi:hypothetical protein